jgi:hypothetical protein
MRYRLKQEVIRKIIEDGILYGKVANVMKITGPSLVLPLRKNTLGLTKTKVLRVIADHLGVSINDLVETVEEVEAA